MMQSLYGHLKNVLNLAPISVTATGTSSTVDMQGFSSCMFLLLVGAFTFTSGNKMTIAIQESDDGTTFTAVADADLLSVESTGVHRVLDGTEDAGTINEFHYQGTKRYLQMKYTETGTVDVPLAVLAVKGNANLKPPL